MHHFEVVWWLYAIESAANEAGEAGDWEAQDFFCMWFEDLRNASFTPKNV